MKQLASALVDVVHGVLQGLAQIRCGGGIVLPAAERPRSLGGHGVGLAGLLRLAQLLKLSAQLQACYEDAGCQRKPMPQAGNSSAEVLRHHLCVVQLDPGGWVVPGDFYGDLQTLDRRLACPALGAAVGNESQRLDILLPSLEQVEEGLLGDVKRTLLHLLPRDRAASFQSLVGWAAHRRSVALHGKGGRRVPLVKQRVVIIRARIRRPGQLRTTGMLASRFRAKPCISRYSRTAALPGAIPVARVRTWRGGHASD